MNQVNLFNFSFMKNNICKVYDEIIENEENKVFLEDYINDENNCEKSILKIYDLIKNNNPRILENDVRSFCNTLNYIKSSGGWNQWVMEYYNNYL